MLVGWAVGRLGKDADLRVVKEASGKEVSVSKFSMACDVGFGDREKTVWVDCTLWGKMAEGLTQYLRKGTQVVLSGDLDVHAWLSKGSEEPGAAIQIRVKELKLCGSKTVAA